MTTRREALNQIVELANTHGLTADEVYAELAPPQESQGSLTGRILAWVGGIFILCGLGFFIENFWAAMNAAARIVLYLGSGMVMLVLALVFIRQTVYEKATLPLFLLAAFFQAGGILMAFDELGTGGDPQLAVFLMTLVMAVQSGLIFWVHRQAVHIFLGMLFAAFSLGNLLELVGMDWDLAAAITGCTVLGITLRWQLGLFASTAPFWFFTGGAVGGYALFDVLEDNGLHLLYLVFPALLIWLSTTVRSRTLLGVGTCAMIGYLGWFTGEYFADSLGWPLALMIIGIVFIVLSIVAVRINRQYIAGNG